MRGDEREGELVDETRGAREERWVGADEVRGYVRAKRTVARGTG